MGNFHPQKEKALGNEEVLCGGNEAVDLRAAADAQISRICQAGRFKIPKLGSKSSPKPTHPRPLGRFPFHFSHFFFFLNGCNHILSSSWFLGSAGRPLKPLQAWHRRNVRIKRPQCRTLRFHLIIINCDDRNNDDDIMIESMCKQTVTGAKTWI